MKTLLELPRRLYDWTLKWASHPRGVTAYVIVSFIESIFFPIPVDPLLMALCLSNYKKSLYYSFIGCVASVIGGTVGYYLGYSAESWVMGFIGKKDFIQTATEMFQANTFNAMFIAGFTFLPFKVFAVTAGLSKVPLVPFILGCIAGRGLRFFLVGGLIYFFGPTIKTFIDKYLEKIFLAIVVICIAIYFIVHFLKG